MYDFDQNINRIGTGSIKWNKQRSFGVANGLLPFWIADTDFATVPDVVDELKKRCEHPIIGYSDYDDKCLDAIQGWYKRRHEWTIPKEFMLPSIGVVTAISFTIQTVTKPGDKVLIFTPVYDPFFAIINNLDRVLVDCELTQIESRYTINYQLLEKQLKQGVKAVVLCNPHNPIGRVWSYEELEQLASLCAKYDVYVLSDEIHGDITLYNNHYTTMGKFPEVYDKLVVFTAISKTFNLAGLSSSCMMIPNSQLKDAVEKSLADKWIFGPNALAFNAIQTAYNNGDEWVDEQNQYLSENATFVKEYFKEHMPNVKVMDIEGTFLMWIDFNCLGMTSEHLTEIMAKRYGIAVSNGEHYGKQVDGYMRLNIGCTKNNLQKGVEIIYKLYCDYNGGNKNG
jgi:cystathionine beta-lyase